MTEPGIMHGYALARAARANAEAARYAAARGITIIPLASLLPADPFERAMSALTLAAGELERLPGTLTPDQRARLTAQKERLP